MSLAGNRKKLRTLMQLHGIGGITVFCLILVSCATPSAKFKPVAPADAEITSTSETQAKSDVVDKCGIANKDSPQDNVVVVQASGGAEVRCPAGTKISSGSPFCLRAGEKVTILGGEGTRVLTGPGCFDAEIGHADQSALSSSSSSRRARTGAVRGAAAATSASPTVDLGEVKVIRGSKSAVKRYKLKATILTGTEICLKQSETLTVLRKKGGVLDLTGPGCNVFRRSGEVVNVAGVSGGQ